MTFTTCGTELRTMECGTCGVMHAIPESMYKSCREEGGFWTCPNGHSRGWKIGSLRDELTKANEEAERLQKRVAYEQTRNTKLENSRRAQKAATTRLKNRAKHGVCPCCTRSFKQLAAHMKNKHPDYIAKG